MLNAFKFCQTPPCSSLSNYNNVHLLASAELLNGSILALHCRDAIRRLTDADAESHQRQSPESHGRRAKRWANVTSWAEIFQDLTHLRNTKRAIWMATDCAIWIWLIWQSGMHRFAISNGIVQSSRPHSHGCFSPPETTRVLPCGAGPNPVFVRHKCLS